MRPFQSHGDGTFELVALRALGIGVNLESPVWIWHPENVSLGDRVFVGTGTMLKGYYKNELVLGNDVFLGRGCFLHAAGSIRIGDGARLGDEVKVLTSVHEEAGRDVPILAAPLRFEAVDIGAGAILGDRVIVLPGVTIGAGAVVEDDALVTRDVAPMTRVAGRPARLLKR
ncbi:MAG: acyltransferase [Myxococcales bacterium]|nr:acyltransferase [Myxococcales bacterium]